MAICRTSQKFNFQIPYICVSITVLEFFFLAYGFRMGNTGIPVADSFRYLAKLIQYCKV